MEFFKSNTFEVNLDVIVLVVNALTHILTLVYSRITLCSMGKWSLGKRPRIISRIPIRHALDKCGLFKTNKYLLTKSPLVLGLIRLVLLLWLIWLDPKKAE